MDGAAQTVEPIRVLYVANRGEIAARIRRTADRLGIRVVVPGQDGHPAVDLLDIAAVVSAAREAGADALHPGFGFLSENAAFADAVETAGIRWVGPPAAAIRQMGNKASARRLAVELGIPVVPGYDDEDQSDATLLEAARAIAGVEGSRRHGVLIKPAAGGGGKGMRVVESLEPPSAFIAALAVARREAVAAFGDERLILERYLVGPRHVEVQVLFDAHGTGVHLGERDCSLQRRHQKIVEETPCPVLDAATRDALCGVAVQGARSLGYHSAGTFEFLLDRGGNFYFLEMNTRLQVEHPITELVTGTDLVREMLCVAAGEPLTLTPSARGVAIEARLCAEEPARGFVPSPGSIERLVMAAGPGVRVDSGVYPGATVSPHYDPLLAKLSVWAPTRERALARLLRALGECTVVGIATNLAFLERLVATPEVAAGAYDTGFVERRAAELTAPLADTNDDAFVAAAAVLAHLDAGRGAANGRDGASAGSGALAPWVAVERAERLGR